MRNLASGNQGSIFKKKLSSVIFNPLAHGTLQLLETLYLVS